jgi:hypothetical protein
MANPTTNFGWQMPTSTDLVTDLPADFEVFGQAVDTALVDLKGGTTGQVLSKTSGTDMDFTWVDTDDTNAIQNAIVDAKGDLIAASAADTPARLAVGADGETLVADSSTSTGLKWAAPSGGGINPNATINGGFDIWQRGTSFTALGKTFTADRWWKFRGGDATGGTWSRQNSATSAPGTQYCMRIQRDSGNTGTGTLQLYTDFETNSSIIYAGQAITVSFYARKGANYSGGDFNLTLQTGTGTDQSQFAGFTGETTVLTVTATSASMNTSTFVRYTGTVTLATTVTQLGLKAIWTPTGTAGAADFVEITGIKLEEGSTATDFVRSGGTIQGELAACQRYYYVHTTGLGNDIAGGWYYSATSVRSSIKFPVAMRVVPTLVATSGTDHYKFEVNGGTDYFNDLIINSPTTNSTGIYTNSNVSGTAGQAGQVFTANASSSLAFNSEL